MTTTERTTQPTSVSRGLPSCSRVAAGLVLVSVAVLSATGGVRAGQEETAVSLRTADLFALQQRFGAAEPVKESCRLFGQHVLAGKWMLGGQVACDSGALSI